MFDTLLLVKAAILTGLVGVGHYIYSRMFVPANNELKKLEYRATGRFFLILCALSLILLVLGKFSS